MKYIHVWIPLRSPFALQIALLQVELFKKDGALLFSKRRNHIDCTKKKEILCHVQQKAHLQVKSIEFHLPLVTACGLISNTQATLLQVHLVNE